MITMIVTRLTFLPLFFLSIICFLFLGYYTPRPVRLLYVAVVSGTFLGLLNHVPGEQTGNDYTFSIFGIAWIYKTLQMLVIETNIYDDFYRLDDKGKSGEKAQQYKDLSVWPKWAWCVTQCFSMRGIGLSWAIPHLPKALPPSTTALEYVWASVLHICWLYLLQDMGRTALSTNRFVQTGGRAGTRISDTGGAERLGTVLAVGLGAYVYIDIPYTVLCAVGVSSGWFWARPQDNHPVIGRWRDAWTVRRFWGRVWHQTFRKPWQSISQFLARRVLHAPKGSVVSRYTQIYFSFFLSAFMHAAAAYTADPRRRSWIGTWIFFLNQANGIVVEDLAQWAGRKLGVRESRITHVAGGIWVVCWFAWTAPWFFDDIVEIGLVRQEAFPWSVVRGLSRGQWRTVS